MSEIRYIKTAQDDVELLMQVRLEDIKRYCRNMKMVTEEFPFGDVPICYKLFDLGKAV